MVKGAREKTTSSVGSGKEAVSQARTWHESNCALARLLKRHRRVLGKAQATAVDIPPGDRRTDTVDDSIVPSDLPLLPRTLLHHQHGMDRFSGPAGSPSARRTHPPLSGRIGTRSGLSVFEPSGMPPATPNPTVDVY
jgi:hypothetical protein